MEHSSRLADLPQRLDLNRVRNEFLDTFVTALLQMKASGGTPPLDRFKLAGVIATWWTDTLPDFKTLLENGFTGVIDGWVDAIADAVEDDDNTGPAFDPFGHKLVRRTMTDYLDRIATAKADITRLKGEKETFEQSNAPDDLEEEGLATWNYAKDLEGQIKEAKDGIKEKMQAAKPHGDKLKALAKTAKAAEKTVSELAGDGTKSIARARKKGLPTAELEESLRQNKVALKAAQQESEQLTARIAGIEASCQPERDRIVAIEAELKPYEEIKQQLAEARARYRTLTDKFVNELKSRCGAMNDNQKRALVLELFAQDVQTGLDAAVAEKRQELVHFIEGLWDKYRVTLNSLRTQRHDVEAVLNCSLEAMRYV